MWLLPRTEAPALQLRAQSGPEGPAHLVISGDPRQQRRWHEIIDTQGETDPDLIDSIVTLYGSIASKRDQKGLPLLDSEDTQARAANLLLAGLIAGTYVPFERQDGNPPGAPTT
ncbi:MAG: hypothetical protein R3F33_14570 [Planctomycetota bacterium]